LVDLKTFKYLSKYLFKKRRQWYFRERDASENISAIENKDCEPRVWMIHGVFIIYESYIFMERND